MISEADTTAIRAIAERHIEGWPLSGTLRADIERALLAARHQAEEAMRERCAIVCDSAEYMAEGAILAGDKRDRRFASMATAKLLAAAIRSIDTRGE